MLGAAGWLAAGCLFAFFVLEWHFNDGVKVALGLLVCTASVAFYRLAGRNAFIRQFAFALSLAGTGLTTWGLINWGIVYRWFGKDGILLLLGCLFALLFAAIPDFTHRIWASGAGSAALACGVLFHIHHGFARAGAFEIAGLFCIGMTGLWLAGCKCPRRNALLRSGAYGVTLAFLPFAAWANFMPGFWFERVASAHVYAWAVCGSLAFLWVALVLCQRENMVFRARSGAALLAFAALLALINLKLTCLAPCLTLLLLGFGQSNRVLMGIGIIALLAYLNFYYYTLAATLLQKSLYMTAGGAALLAARFVMLRLWPETAEEEAKEVKEGQHA
jgi:hypothetical protein